MVYPLALYHGKACFKSPMDFLSLIDGEAEDIARYFQSDAGLINFAQLSDDVLLNNPQQLCALPQFCLKHIRDRDMLNALTRHARVEAVLMLFNQYVKNAGMEMARTLLKYIYYNARISDMGEFADFIGQIRPELEETVMTAEQAAISRGREEGMRAGREEGAQSMLHKLVLHMLSIGELPSKVAQLCNVPLSTVLALQKNHTATA